MLLNQILVCWSVHNKANLLMLGCGEEKHSIYFKAEQRHRLLMLKFDIPDRFQGSILKGNLRERTKSCVMESFQHSLTRGDVTGANIISPQAPANLGLIVHDHHAISSFYLVGVLVSQNNSEICVRYSYLIPSWRS